jgi:serine protease Do
MGKTLDGRNDYLDITFAKNRLRVPGRLTRVSDEADVAMVKLDLPQSVHKVELNDNYSSIRPGDPITVMGYPSVSPPVYGIVASRDPFSSGQSAHIIPDPTISIGNIARVIRGQSTPSVSEAIESSMGDAYQLTVNSTGAGNSGGPVFDEHGHAVGIFTSSIRSDAMITFAVPIRYGMDLMGINKIAQ